MVTVSSIFTYTLWCLNMLHKHNKLLTGYETFESRVIAIAVSGDMGVRAFPNNIDSLWEKGLHEKLMATDFKRNMALAKTASTTSGTVGFIACDGIDGLVYVNKFHKCIHRLASDTLHDNMDRLISLGD